MMNQHSPAQEPLEALLVAWGAAQSLSAERAAQLRVSSLAAAGLVDEPAPQFYGPLSSEWWTALAQSMCSTLALATKARSRPVLPLPVIPS